MGQREQRGGTAHHSQSPSLELIGPLWNTDFPITRHASTHICVQLAPLVKTQRMFYEIQQFESYVKKGLNGTSYLFLTCMRVRRFAPQRVSKRIVSLSYHPPSKRILSLSISHQLLKNEISLPALLPSFPSAGGHSRQWMP